MYGSTPPRDANQPQADSSIMINKSWKHPTAAKQRSQAFELATTTERLQVDGGSRGGGYSHTLHIRVCAAQRGRDFEAPDLERGIHFRGVF